MKVEQDWVLVQVVQMTNQFLSLFYPEQDTVKI